MIIISQEQREACRADWVQVQVRYTDDWWHADDMFNWCLNSLGPKLRFSHVLDPALSVWDRGVSLTGTQGWSYWFKNPEDATAFILRWL